MEIGMFFIGIYEILFSDFILGVLLIGTVCLLWIIGLIWDRIQFKDWFYSWKSLKKLWCAN